GLLCSSASRAGATRRSAERSRATSAAAPGTGTSSRPSRPRAARRWLMSETTVVPERVEVEAPAEPQRWAGQSLPRKEDGRLLQGQGVFVDDIKRQNMGYAHYVRSPYGHAVIKSVDVSAALAVPGVYGTLTGDEVATLTDPFFQIG